MASINYLFKGKKNPANLYCRFTNGRATDLWQPLNLFLDPKHWDQSKQRIKNVLVVNNRDEINKKLTQLKIHLLDDFNLAYMKGDVIDRPWLSGSINVFFNRPTQEVKNVNLPHTIYITDFANWWIKERAPKWVTGNSSYLNARSISQYNSFIKMLERFEKKHKIKLKDIDNELINGFVDFLAEDNYSSKTIARHITRFKFFCFRAEENNITINNNFKQKVFIPPTEEIKEPYLNQKEIESIFNHDFSKNEILDNVRDNLIISVWTGLRISDFNTLNIDNFIDDFIEIKTRKTGARVTIPIHPHVKKILIKRNGELPKQLSDQKYNDYVKTVCRKVGLKTEMQGRLFDKDLDRKKSGFFPKYKLVSSHIGRRSFATNHFGKVSNQVIMKIGGWASEGMMLKYIKKSDKSYAVELKRYWDSELA